MEELKKIKKKTIFENIKSKVVNDDGLLVFNNGNALAGSCFLTC